MYGKAKASKAKKKFGLKEFGVAVVSFVMGYLMCVLIYFVMNG